MTDPNMESMVVAAEEQRRSRYFGKYRGIVRDVKDDEKLGRIVARVPEVYGENDSPWALPCVPFAGKKHGLVLLPEVGDGVWIEFEAGDPSRPIYSGFWWASNEIPEPGDTKTRVLATTDGHKLILDDKANQVQLLHADGAELTMTKNDITLKIGSSKIVLSSAGVNINNGAFEVK